MFFKTNKELKKCYEEISALIDNIEDMNTDIFNKNAEIDYLRKISNFERIQKMELINKIDDFKSLAVVALVVVVCFYLMVI